MGYHYSDPTANMAMGALNREYAKWEKKATLLCERWEKGELSLQELARAEAQFTGLYRHVLAHTFQKRQQKRQNKGE